MSFNEHAVFQEIRSLHPRPPSSLERVTVSHATLAEWLPSAEPCHKKEPQRESIFLMHALGSTKVDDQKLVIPAMTVLIINSLPANDNALELQESIFPLMCCSRGEQR